MPACIAERHADELYAYLQAESLKSQPPSLLSDQPGRDAISSQQQCPLPGIVNATAADLSIAAASALLSKENILPHIAASGSMPSADAQLAAARAAPSASAPAISKSFRASSGSQERMTRFRQHLVQPAPPTLVSQPRMRSNKTS